MSERRQWRPHLEYLERLAKQREAQGEVRLPRRSILGTNVDGMKSLSGRRKTREMFDYLGVSQPGTKSAATGLRFTRVRAWGPLS